MGGAPAAARAKPRAGARAVQANAHRLPAPPSLFPDPTGFPEWCLPLPHPSRAAEPAPRGAKPCPVPPWLLAQPRGRACARPPVPPRRVPCPRSHRGRGQGRTATPATSVGAVSTSWREPVPRDASSTAGASSAGAAGPPCAWATTPSTRRMVRWLLRGQGMRGARLLHPAGCHMSSPLLPSQVVFTARCTTPIHPARSCPGMRLQRCLLG